MLQNFPRGRSAMKGGRSAMLQTFPPRGRFAMLQIFRGEGLQCCRPSGGRSAREKVCNTTPAQCAGGPKKKLYLRSCSQRHRHFLGFLTVPVQAPTRVSLFIQLFRETAPFIRLLRHAGDMEDVFSS